LISDFYEQFIIPLSVLYPYKFFSFNKSFWGTFSRIDKKTLSLFN
jgi:hypothetical protein